MRPPIMACLLLALISGIGCSRAPDKVVIRTAAEMPHLPRGEAPAADDVFSMTDPSQIDRLLSYFSTQPVLADGRPLAGSWLAVATIQLHIDGEVVRTIHTDLQHWNDGGHDHLVKPGLGRFMRQQRAMIGDQP